MVVGIVAMMVMIATEIMVMMRRVRADAFDVVMVPLLWRSDRSLVPDDPFAVAAQQAVHVDVPGRNALDPLEERIEDERVVVEIAGLHELDRGMPGGNLVGLGVDAADQNPGE